MTTIPTDPGPDRNGEAWNFCGKCGSRMGWMISGVGFSRVTGKPGRIYVWSCPQWDLQSSRHDRASHTVHQLQVAEK